MKNAPTNTMPVATDLLETIRGSESRLTLAELLGHQPNIARRTAQRLIAKLIESGHITAQGEGRARRYHADSESHTEPRIAKVDSFPAFIPLSADSLDILAYTDQPLPARKPVGYQHDFLQTYHPNETCYLSE